MVHIKEFSRFASHYQTYNIIQKQVAEELVGHIHSAYPSVLDLGCGSGVLCALLESKTHAFIGVDLSLPMLELHPKNDRVSCIQASFDDAEFWDRLPSIALIVSSSALQWSKDLGYVFERIAKTRLPFALALFTANTFHNVHKAAGIVSPLRSYEEVVDLAHQSFEALSIEKQTYRLFFENSRELFGYIKKSGVSGAKKQLTYKETKKLIENFTDNYLEFEVVFLLSPQI